MRTILIAMAIRFLIGTQASASASGFDYICIQPGDEIYTTAPSVAWTQELSSLKPEYRGDQLFQSPDGNRDLHVFRPNEDVEIRIDSADFEGEVVFDRVRFLVAEGRLYTWIGMRATTYNGVAHKIVRTVRIRGREIGKSRPMTVDVRKTLVGCN
jgi:hypothetical protein